VTRKNYPQKNIKGLKKVVLMLGFKGSKRHPPVTIVNLIHVSTRNAAAIRALLKDDDGLQINFCHMSPVPDSFEMRSFDETLETIQELLKR
jgi:hypothetical protein